MGIMREKDRKPRGRGTKSRAGCWRFKFHRLGIADNYDPEMECVSKNYWNQRSQRSVKPGYGTGCPRRT